MSSNDNLISDMFRTALQLEDPWKLAHIEFDDQDQAWHLFIEFRKGDYFCLSTLWYVMQSLRHREKTLAALGFLGLEDIHAC